MISDLATLASGENIPTMSSLQIAELAGKRHDNVMADIRSMLKDTGADALKFQGVYKGGNGQDRKCFYLPEHELLVLLTGYSAPLRSKIIGEWQAMKGQIAASRDPMEILADPAAMRSLLLGYSEKVLSLQTTVSELEPKAEGLRLLSISEGSTCISRAAKSLGVEKIKDLFDWLHEKKWIFRRGGEWIAHQDRLRSGHLEDKTTTVDRGDGSSKTVHQTLVTSKGLALLAEYMAKGALK